MRHGFFKAIAFSCLTAFCIVVVTRHAGAQDYTDIVILDSRSLEILGQSQVASHIYSELTSRGVRVISVGYTMLGRLRFVVEDGNLRREIVAHRRTGEVLRDVEFVLENSIDHPSEQPNLPNDQERTSKSPSTSVDTTTDVDGATTNMASGLSNDLAQGPTLQSVTGLGQ